MEKEETTYVWDRNAGVSIGDYDYVKEVLIEMGMQVKFWKVAIKPGKPVLFGEIGNTLVFGLPGNLTSSMLTFEQFVAPAVLKMQGRGEVKHKTIKTILEEDLSKRDENRHFIRALVHNENGKNYVKPVEPQGSGGIKSMVLANCLIVFILAAVLTPGLDIFCQLLMALPLLIIFEISIFLSRLVNSSNKRYVH